MKIKLLAVSLGLLVLLILNSPVQLMSQDGDIEERVDWLLNKGWELYDQKSYVVAEIMLQNALARAEELGDDHPKHAMTHYALGRVLEAEEKFDQAETQYLESVSVWSGVQSPTQEVIEPVEGLGRIFSKQERYPEAENYFLLAVKFWEGAPQGEFHGEKAGATGNLASVYFRQERYEEAEPLLLRALELERVASNPAQFEIAFRIHDLAVFYQTVKKYADAESLYKSAIRTLEDSNWEDMSDLAMFVENYVSLLRETDRAHEAEEWEAKAAGLREELKSHSGTIE